MCVEQIVSRHAEQHIRIGAVKTSYIIVRDVSIEFIQAPVSNRMVQEDGLSVGISWIRQDSQNDHAAGGHAEGVAENNRIVAGVIGLRAGDCVIGTGVGSYKESAIVPKIIQGRRAIGGDGKLRALTCK